MAEVSATPLLADAAGTHLPEVRFEARHGAARPSTHAITDAAFLIGTVPGCDLRLPGASLPPVLCLIARQPHGVVLRRVAPTFPVLVNGKPAAFAELSDGDRVSLGAVELVFKVDVRQAVRAPRSSPVAEPPTVPSHSLDEERRHLEEQTRELETDRVLWYRRRQEMEQEAQQLAERERTVATAFADVHRRELALSQEREASTQRLQDLETRTALLARQKQEFEAVRQEFTSIRQQLYDRYRERRDRLAGLQEAVNRAAQKVQEQKREVEAQTQQAASRRAELDAREAALDAPARELANLRRSLVDERRRLDDHMQMREREVNLQRADLEERERRLTEERQALDKAQAQHKSDLLRIDRREAALEERQQELQARALQIDRRFEELQRDSRDLEEQAQRLDEWHVQLSADADALANQHAALEPHRVEVQQRAATLEGQQAMLATLRSRLERMREDVRRESQQLAEQREKQEAAELDLQQRLAAADRLRAELEAERQAHEQERRGFAERGGTMEAAVAQLRELQDKLAVEEEQLRQRVAAFDTRFADSAEQAALVQARAQQLTELQQRLEADRQALRERAAALTQAEQARVALQEQLQRRADELAARQRALAEQARKQEEAAGEFQTRLAEVDERRAEVEREREQAEARFAARVRELEEHEAELKLRREKLEATQRKIADVGRTVADERKALVEERTQQVEEEQTVAQTLDERRAALSAYEQEVLALQQQLPELETRGKEAVAGLAVARDQLRECLAELHAYARQGREDLESLRGQVQAEVEQVRQRELALDRARDEHRLAVAAFRQQIIDWQGQVAEMKRSLAQGETRLERRQAEVEEKARLAGETHARLTQRAEELREQQREVAARRSEMERHLADMREWYRKKLRELAESRATPVAEAGAAEVNDERAILTLTGDVEPGDRQLGDLLRTLELVEADTLNALLVEARRQRRSLRQVLLAGNYLTLYQLALIEAGNLDGLVLGPTRVIDRVRATSHEAVYRVFDPRRGREMLLRHLGEADAADAVRPDEFRQRFAAAASVQHPHVAATLELLEIAGRPAVLQEWLSGLAGSDWPALASAPGVWYRLLGQAALGLHTIHQAGLVHGHLDAGTVWLTGDGVLKLAGLGEPPWLVEPAVGEDASTNADVFGDDTIADLAALGRIATGWASGPKRKGSKGLPDSLQNVLERLGPAAGEERFASAAVLLEALDRAGADVPANAEAWERLLRHVREHGPADAELRRSA